MIYLSHPWTQALGAVRGSGVERTEKSSLTIRIIAGLLLVPALCLSVHQAAAQLPAEKLGQVAKLPSEYPAHWFWADDVAFNHMLDGRMILLDADGKTLSDQFKGMFNASLVAAFTQASTRPEVYVAETYYSRGERGKRTDVLTIYDRRTLKPIGEVELPDGKRANMIPRKSALRLLDHEKLMAVYNFTPSTGVTIVDVIKRKVVNQLTMPSCALIYPTGPSGFSALCSNASMISYQLNNAGKVVGKHVLPPFFNIDKDALFSKPAIIRGIAYFPTFLGNVYEVNLRGKYARLGRHWSLVSKAERAENWRPGGIELAGEDSRGRMYILMHEHGVEGSHKNPGSEVWVYDVTKRKRVERVKLKNPGLSVELTRDKHPLLLVVNTDMNVDVYEAGSGKYLRTLSHFGQETPLMLYAAQ